MAAASLVSLRPSVRSGAWIRRVVRKALTAVVLAVAAAAPAHATAGTVTVEPTSVGIDLLFDGATLRVSGVIPAGHQAAVVCFGGEETVAARRKGKVWGVLWMSTGDITFEHVPSLYLLATSAPLTQLAPAAALVPFGLGFDALAAKAVTPGGPEDAAERFRDLVALREGDGLFRIEEGAVRLAPGRSGDLDLRADLFLPARARPGDYEVLVYSFSGSTVHLEGRTTVVLRAAGAARFITAMARRHGLLYGVVSALVAMAAGLLAGVIFGRGRRPAH